MRYLDPVCFGGSSAATAWATPAYCDVRLGFEVTAYIYVR
jgi:pyrroloquinoline quinone biosynthesis protein A